MLKSPTLSQIGRMLLMQVISSYQWDLQLGDIKGAFLESGPSPLRPSNQAGYDPNSTVACISCVTISLVSVESWECMLMTQQ